MTIPTTGRELCSLYSEYKEDTKWVASWLAMTAKACGFPESRFTPIEDRKYGGSGGGGGGGGKRRRVLAIRDFMPLAEFIASSGSRWAVVPAAFIHTTRRVIRLRERYSVQLHLQKVPEGSSSSSSDRENEAAADRGHLHFNEVLGRVHDTLLPLVERHEDVSAGHVDDDYDANMSAAAVAAMSLDDLGHDHDDDDADETTEDKGKGKAGVKADESRPVFERPEPAKPDNVEYDAEKEESASEAFLNYFIMIEDLQKMRFNIRNLWEWYMDGRMLLVTAALVTNAYVGLAREASREAVASLARHGSYRAYIKAHSNILKAATFDDNTPKVSLTSRAAPSQASTENNRYTEIEALSKGMLIASDVLQEFTEIVRRTRPFVKEQQQKLPARRGGDGNPVPMLFTRFTKEDRGLPQLLCCQRTAIGGQHVIEAQKKLLQAFLEDAMVAGQNPGMFVARDELVRGLGELMKGILSDEEGDDEYSKPVDVPFHLVFAAQVYLDVHFQLGCTVTEPLNSLMNTVNYMGQSIATFMESHAFIKDPQVFVGWGADDLDLVMKDIETFYNDAVATLRSQRDYHQAGDCCLVMYQGDDGPPTTRSMPVEELPTPSKDHRLWALSPVMAGLTEFAFRSRLRQVGIRFANASATILGASFMCKALRSEGHLPEEDEELSWGALQGAAMVLGEESLCPGGFPSDRESLRRRFGTMLGLSLAETGKVKGRRHEEKRVKHTKGGVRLIEDRQGIPIHAVFEDMVMHEGPSIEWTAEMIGRVTNASRYRFFVSKLIDLDGLQGIHFRTELKDKRTSTISNSGAAKESQPSSSRQNQKLSKKRQKKAQKQAQNQTKKQVEVARLAEMVEAMHIGKELLPSASSRSLLPHWLALALSAEYGDLAFPFMELHVACLTFLRQTHEAAECFFLRRIEARPFPGREDLHSLGRASVLHVLTDEKCLAAVGDRIKKGSHGARVGGGEPRCLVGWPPRTTPLGQDGSGNKYCQWCMDGIGGVGSGNGGPDRTGDEPNETT